MLTISNLTYRISGRPLLIDASCVIPTGSKVGLVGRNGTGKSTLFRLITGEILAESGDTNLARNLKIGSIAQEAPGDDRSLIDTVLEADMERTELLAEADQATDPDRIAEIHLRLADIDSHTAEARAGAILSGLGFSVDEQKQPCSSFSGGWRMRVALASLLFTEPDLLLLDEPTNYLDLEGTLWLEGYLAKYPGTIILISHDRDLLNTCVDRIVHLDQLELTTYTGGYDQFEKQRAAQMILSEKMRQKQATRRKHMEAFVERFRYKASKARQAQSRLKMLEKLGPIAAVVDEQSAPIRFQDPASELSPPLIRMEEVAVGYAPDTPVLSNLNSRIDPDDRIGLLGANGNGKSTFAKLLAGRLTPSSGTMTKASKLKVAYFAQHQLDELDPGKSPVEQIARLMPNQSPAKVRARVDQMGLPTSRMDTPARDLSGGEKARLLLGLATFHGPHIIILDEPTNHLDVDSRSALIEAVNAFRGAVLLISHDRHLIEASADRLWLVADGRVTDFDGDMDDYKRFVLTGKPVEPKRLAKGKPVIQSSFQQDPSARDRRKDAAQKRARLAPLRKHIDGAEKKMGELRRELDRLDGLLANPDLYATNPDEGTRLAKKRSATERNLIKVEEDWLSMSEDYETQMAS